MVSLASMAMPADSNVMAVVKNEVFGITNFVPPIYYEKSATRNVFLRKRKCPRRNLLKASSIIKDAKSFEINCTLGESTFINLLLHFWTDLA